MGRRPVSGASPQTGRIVAPPSEPLSLIEAAGPCTTKSVRTMQLTFNIADVSHLQQRSIHFAMNCVFGGGGPKDREAYFLVMNFARLVDFAIREYEYGRKATLEFAEDTDSLSLGLIFRASGHFEVCIDNVKRAIEHLKALRMHPKVPQPIKALLPRGIKVLSRSVEVPITGMRNAIQHLENRIKKGEIADGQSLALLPSENELELGVHRIPYADLAEWLTELHALSDRLAHYRDN